jgi:hypothetical protein
LVAAGVQLCCALSFVSLAPPQVVRAEAGIGDWTFESRGRGITVSKRERSGDSLSAFRGDGVVRAHVLQVLAVILDVQEIERWAYGVSSARSLSHVDDRTELIYLYSNTPWPVRDRDMVVRRKVNVIKPGEEFAISFRCEPSAGHMRQDVIRVRACESSFRVRKLDELSTAITYEMSLDPQGHVPEWASAWVARTAPVKTLLAIESRAVRSYDRYAAVVDHWSTAL